jgi:hypothetical protein
MVLGWTLQERKRHHFLLFSFILNKKFLSFLTAGYTPKNAVEIFVGNFMLKYEYQNVQESKTQYFASCLGIILIFGQDPLSLLKMLP